MDSIAILTGGGPAPGMNTVVGSVAKTFLQKGYRVIGLHGGYSGLFNKNPKTTDIDFLLADDIFNRGGSFPVISQLRIWGRLLVAPLQQMQRPVVTGL